MKTVEDKLLLDLQKDKSIKVLHRASWLLPMQERTIHFERTIHSKMDILMKMLLLTFQKTEITSVEELSDMLFVELLFIRDLINKLSAAKLIVKQGASYQLTEVGQIQLGRGIFEHEPEADTKTLLYSAFHESYYGKQALVSSGDELDYFRYQARASKVDQDDTEVINMLQKSDVKPGEKEVLQIISMDSVAVEGIMCCEFHLYNEATDTMYARVWNTASELWDDVLEEVIIKKEGVKWRERYF